MRINARLDGESEDYLEKIKQVKGFETITDALKYSLKEVASHLEAQGDPGDQFQAFLNSEYVGQFDGPEDGSVNYKDDLLQGLKSKHGIV